MMGFERVGAVALLLKENSLLEHNSGEVVTFIEQGKILDYLHLKQHRLLGFIDIEPTLPEVCYPQRNWVEKVLMFNFPGDCVKYILGRANLK
jgi:hypothetical protein